MMIREISNFRRAPKIYNPKLFIFLTTYEELKNGKYEKIFKNLKEQERKEQNSFYTNFMELMYFYVLSSDMFYNLNAIGHRLLNRTVGEEEFLNKYVFDSDLFSMNTAKYITNIDYEYYENLNDLLSYRDSTVDNMRNKLNQTYYKLESMNYHINNNKKNLLNIILSSKKII